MSNYNPVIVVVAFNRPRSLERLLYSLKNAKKISNARLIISIDNLEPHNYNIKEIAEAFQWPYGEKEVIYHKQRLGLRKHILQCGDYASKYGSVIILEDDLFVSPYFYDYAIQTLNFYHEDPRIGGISLYNQPYEEVTYKPFTSIFDCSDVYFVQFPSSLGQVWTKKQWESFKSWYESVPEINNLNIPDKILNWPETSWKKYFCAYLIHSHKFFVFPKKSLTTNFNDPGTNLKSLVNHDGQTQLSLCEYSYRLIHVSESICRYDVYFELLTECVNRLTNRFIEYDYEMDLYGVKDLGKIKSVHIITSRPVKKSIAGFKRALKPHEMNIIFNLRGDDLFLCKKEDAEDMVPSIKRYIADYKYYFYRRLPGLKVWAYNFIAKRFKM